MDDRKEPGDDDVRQQAESDFKAALEEAKQVSRDDLFEGRWFAKLMRHAISTYAKKVNAEYFEKKYPGLNRDAIVDRRISLAQRYAAAVGFSTSSAYSAAIAATIGTGGGASPLSVPAAVAAFTADLLLISRFQLELAYDLSVLYRHRIDLDDPEDLIALIKVAFGVKAGEQLQEGITKLAPEITRQTVKRVFTGSIAQWAKALPVVGKYLLQRNVIKFAIPVVSIPLSTGLNFWTTGRVARVARQMFRDKALIREVSPKFAEDLAAFPRLLLEALWLMSKADGETSEEESWLLRDVAASIEKMEGGAEVVAGFREMVDCKETDVLARVRELPPEVKPAIYDAVCRAAIVDHRLHKKEKALLIQFAEACGVTFELDKLQELMRQSSV